MKNMLGMPCYKNHSQWITCLSGKRRMRANYPNTMSETITKQFCHVRSLITLESSYQKQVVRRSNVPLSAKIFCEVCGSSYGPRTWHTGNKNSKQYKHRARVWHCHKLTACGTFHVYDEPLEMALDAAVRDFWDKRQDIMEVLEDILGVDVSQNIRDVSSDRNDVGMIVEKIIVRKDRRLDFTFIDDSGFEYELGDWTPRGSPAGRRKRAKD